MTNNMKPVIPYVDENRQVIFINIENDTIHDVVNGALLAIIVFGGLFAFAVLLG